MIQVVCFLALLGYSAVAAYTLDHVTDRVVEDKRPYPWLWVWWIMFAAYAWPVYWTGRMIAGPETLALPPGEGS